MAELPHQAPHVHAAQGVAARVRPLHRRVHVPLAVSAAGGWLGGSLGSWLIRSVNTESICHWRFRLQTGGWSVSWFRLQATQFRWEVGWGSQLVGQLGWVG